jgi:hypothetical protein
MQPPSTILMIQPAAFGFNPLTDVFGSLSHLSPKHILERALDEFDIMVNSLLQCHINVLVAGDTVAPTKPAAIFPANWFCTMPNGSVTVFPMYSPNRRAEKRDDILMALSRQFVVKDMLDLGEYETEGLFLEGTASMAIDHEGQIIYACLTGRTHKTLVQHFARYHGYRAMAFTATSDNGQPIHYTNDILSIGERFAVLCETAIENEFERIAVKQLLSTTGHTLIPVSIEQALQFAANIVQVKNTKGDNILILSKQAFNSLTREQLKKLHSFGELLTVAIPTIENIGGSGIGSMVAPVFLAAKGK